MHTFGKRRDSAAEGTEGANAGKLDGVGQLQPHLLQLALLSSPFVCVEINLRRCEATCLVPHSQNNLGFTHLAQGLLRGETYCSKVSHLPRRCGVGRWFWNPLPFNWRQLDCKSLRCCPGAYRLPLRGAGLPSIHGLPWLPAPVRPGVPFCSSLKEEAWGFATTNTVLPPRLYLPSSAAYLCTPLKHKLAHLPYTPPSPQGCSLASQLRSWSHEPKTGPARPESWDRSPDLGGTGVASEA